MLIRPLLRPGLPRGRVIGSPHLLVATYVICRAVGEAGLSPCRKPGGDPQATTHERTSLTLYLLNNGDQSDQWGKAGDAQPLASLFSMFNSATTSLPVSKPHVVHFILLCLTSSIFLPHLGHVVDAPLGSTSTTITPRLAACHLEKRRRAEQREES